MCTSPSPTSSRRGPPVPLSAFRYAERTREPLVLDDATRDDRFAGDPYLAGLPACSLLVVPILSQGQPRAQSNGLISGTPVRTTSATLRVTNVNLWTLAVAAIRPSMTGGG